MSFNADDLSVVVSVMGSGLVNTKPVLDFKRLQHLTGMEDLEKDAIELHYGVVFKK